MSARPRSRDEWATIIERYRRSGLTQREFCEREGVSTAALQHWLYRPSKPLAEPASKFVEVIETRPDPSTRRAFVRVKEVEVEVAVGDAAELVASLLDLLDRRSARR